MPSSVINWYNYNKEKKELLIGFVSGIRYIYKKVPQSEYDKFKNAISKGKYLNEHIKEAYAFERMEP